MAKGFRDHTHSRARGNAGEDEAARWLQRAGYRLIERNFTCRAGELDVVAEEAGDLCFIEVKARSNRAFGRAIEAISPSKQRRIARAATWYLMQYPTDRPCRFDVLAMDLDADGAWRFELVRDAFRL